MTDRQTIIYGGAAMIIIALLYGAQRADIDPVTEWRAAAELRKQPNCAQPPAKKGK